MKKFSEWTLQDAQAAIAKAIDGQVGRLAFDQNKAFIEEEDHWQNGEGWMVHGASAALRAAILKEVRPQFVQRDVMNEVLERQANALLQRVADIDFIPVDPIEDPDVSAGATDEQRAELLAGVEALREQQADEVRELKRQVIEWLSAQDFWTKARKAVVRSRWGARGSLRTFVEYSNIRQAGTEPSEQTVAEIPSGLTIQEALETVRVNAPGPDEALVIEDDETGERAAIFLVDLEGSPGAELWYTEGGSTRLRILKSGTDGTEEYEPGLAGELPIAEFEADLLIGESARRQQKRLNFFETMLVRVGETAGHPERYTTNAEPSGLWLTSQPTNGPALEERSEAGKTWYLHAVERQIGAAITTNLVGILDEGSEADRRATPGVVFRDPTDPEYITKACQYAYRSMLTQCKQGHIGVDSTGEASGYAYEQARADFLADLNNTGVPLVELLRGAVVGALAWAGEMSTEAADVLERYRVSVSLNITAGPISVAQQQQNNLNVDAGTLSKESAMAANGVEDVDAELEKIRTSPESLVELRAKQVTSILAMKAEGVPLATAARIMGVTDADALRLFEAAESEAAAPDAQADAQDREIEDALLAGTGAS